MTARHTQRGFTLIELLVVIGILAILVALVVGVGGAVQARGKEEKTRAYMGALQAAIMAFHDAKGFYPRLGSGSAEENGAYLVRQLQDVPAARQSLASIGNEVSENAGDGKPIGQVENYSMPAPYDVIDGGPKTYNYYLDAWGRPIIYDPVGGPGQTPVFISTGRDLNEAADDLRSDKR